MAKEARKDLRVAMPPGSALVREIKRWAEAENRTMAGMVRCLLYEAARARHTAEVERLEGVEK